MTYRELSYREKGKDLLMTDLPQLPFERSSLLGISSMFGTLRVTEPITRVRTRTGDEAWLVTGYEEVRALFADERLGRSHPSQETAPRISNLRPDRRPER